MFLQIFMQTQQHLSISSTQRPQVYRPLWATLPALSFYVTHSPSWLPFRCFPPRSSIHLALPSCLMSCHFPVHHASHLCLFGCVTFHCQTHMAYSLCTQSKAHNPKCVHTHRDAYRHAHVLYTEAEDKWSRNAKLDSARQRRKSSVNRENFGWYILVKACI